MDRDSFRTELEQALAARDRAQLTRLSDVARKHRELGDLWREYEMLERQIDLWKQDVPRVDLTARILGELHAETMPVKGHPVQNSRNRQATWSIGTLLAVVILLGTAVAWMRTMDNDLEAPDDDFIAQQPETTSPVENVDDDAVSDVESDEELVALLGSVGDAYGQLAQETYSSFSAGEVLLAGLSSLPPYRTQAASRDLRKPTEPESVSPVLFEPVKKGWRSIWPTSESL